MRTVDLEFLRQGPAHNRPLSPLTNYLANCGDFATTTVNVPWEHADLMRAMKDLRYTRGLGADTAAERNQKLDQLGEEVSELLGGIDGLAANTPSNDACGSAPAASSPALVHLNLIVSASELALVPFELTRVPRGCDGHEDGRWLLQENPRVCLTRRVRSASRVGVRWPTAPRILFVAASPDDYAPVPMRRHFNALVRALQPFIGPYETKEQLKKNLEKIVTVLPRATHDDIIEACAQTTFTHVHVLAHGVQDAKREGSPYGLALHSSRNTEREHVISGDDFVSCFTTSPSVMTVSSCDSGNVGDVVYGGASFAHQAHQRGVPFVAASQFPLTFDGSATMVDILYRNLLTSKWVEVSEPAQLARCLQPICHRVTTID